MNFEHALNWILTPENALSAAQVFAALVTAAATYALWRVTRVLAIETSELANMTSKPFVVGTLESSGASPSALNLVLRNTGNAAAFDIQLKLTPPLPDHHGNVDPDSTETTKEISLLPPGQVLPLTGVMGREIHGVVYDVTVSWTKEPGGANRDSLDYKVSTKEGFSGGWNAKNMHHVATELQKIRENMRGQ